MNNFLSQKISIRIAFPKDPLRLPGLWPSCPCAWRSTRWLLSVSFPLACATYVDAPWLSCRHLSQFLQSGRLWPGARLHLFCFSAGRLGEAVGGDSPRATKCNTKTTKHNTKQSETKPHIKQNEARTNQTNLATLPQTSLVIPPIMRNSWDLGNTRVILATPLAILATPLGIMATLLNMLETRGGLHVFLYRRAKQRNINKTFVRFEKVEGEV